MKKSLNDLKYDFGKIFVTAGMAPVYISPFLPGHPFESFWTWFVCFMAIFVGILLLKSSIQQP